MTVRSRRWFQLRLSTILLLTAIAAIATAWWVDHTRLRKQLQSRETQIRAFALQNIQATAAADTLKRLFPLSGLAPTRVAVDARANQVIVSSSGETLEVIEALLTRLDE